MSSSSQPNIINHLSSDVKLPLLMMEETQPATAQKCSICRKPKPTKGLVQLSCSHFWCKSCFKGGLQLVSSVDKLLLPLSIFTVTNTQQAASNVYFFPIQCCQTPIKFRQNLVELVGERIALEYTSKEMEFSTTGPRTYCPDLKCEAVIPPILMEGRIALCPCCQKWMCRKCQSADDHEGKCKTSRFAERILKFARGPAGKPVPGCPRCGDQRAVIGDEFEVM